MALNLSGTYAATFEHLYNSAVECDCSVRWGVLLRGDEKVESSLSVSERVGLLALLLNVDFIPSIGFRIN